MSINRYHGIRRALQCTYKSMVCNCGKIQSHAMVRYMNESFYILKSEANKYYGRYKMIYSPHTIHIYIHLQSIGELGDGTL